MTINKPVLVLAALLTCGGCTLTPPVEDPVLLKLDELERRLQNIERIVDNQSLVQLTQQVSSLQRRSDELQGRAEILEYDASDTAQRQRQLYADLDERIRGLESSLREFSTSSAQNGGTLSPAHGSSDRDNYQAAFELLKEERYDMAAAAFGQFLVTFPDSDLADNAQYWLAESYYAAKQFERALAGFQIVITDYPRSRKVPDALLKIGYCNYSLERWGEARATLSRVQTDYPETTAARLAGQYLKRMDAEGV